MTLHKHTSAIKQDRGNHKALENILGPMRQVEYFEINQWMTSFCKINLP